MSTSTDYKNDDADGLSFYVVETLLDDRIAWCNQHDLVFTVSYGITVFYDRESGCICDNTPGSMHSACGRITFNNPRHAAIYHMKH